MKFVSAANKIWCESKWFHKKTYSFSFHSRSQLICCSHNLPEIRPHCIKQPCDFCLPALNQNKSNLEISLTAYTKSLRTSSVHGSWFFAASQLYLKLCRTGLVMTQDKTLNHKTHATGHCIEIDTSQHYLSWLHSCCYLFQDLHNLWHLHPLSQDNDTKFQLS